jgi:hypothetical protein
VFQFLIPILDWLRVGWGIMGDGPGRLEEMDLLERLPAYKEYTEQVPPFLTKVRLH